jgi:hypothetical protein
MRRTLIAFLAASLIPPLGAIQLLTAQGKLADGVAWLGVAGIAVSSTSAAAIYTLTLLNRIARLAFALPDTAGLTIPKAKPRNLNLGHRNAHEILALTANHLAVRDVLLEILLDLPFNDRSKTGVILLNVIRHG